MGGAYDKEEKSFQITEHTKVVWQPCRMIPYLHHDFVPKEVNSEEWLENSTFQPSNLAANMVRRNVITTFTEK